MTLPKLHEGHEGQERRAENQDRRVVSFHSLARGGTRCCCEQCEWLMIEGLVYGPEEGFMGYGRDFIGYGW
jgi:hypothetical protein